MTERAGAGPRDAASARATLARYGGIAVRGALHPAGAVLLLDTTLRGGRLSREAAGQVNRALAAILAEAADRAQAASGGRWRFRGHVHAAEGERWATARLERARGPQEVINEQEREREMHEAAVALAKAAGARTPTFHASRAEAIAWDGGPGREPWRRS
jgi:hypothetical protein